MSAIIAAVTPATAGDPNADPAHIDMMATAEKSAIDRAAAAGTAAAMEQIRTAGSNKRAVIGETQTRVNKAALALNAITLQFPEEFTFKQPLGILETSMSIAFNAAWINTLVNNKFTIYDAGLDRRKPVRSEWYALEKNILRIRKYPTIPTRLGD